MNNYALYRCTAEQLLSDAFDGDDLIYSEDALASGYGWAELLSDGSLEGEICTDNGDDIPFIARRPTSSTAC